MRRLLCLLMLMLLPGCAGVMKTAPTEVEGPFHVTAVPDGLPADGLWRESFVLYDVNGDGFSDIIAPPPRKAKADEKRPFIFIFNPKEKRWMEAKYTFPPLGYDYGGVAVGDVNRDGLFDLALASHASSIFVLINNGDGSFREMPFSPKVEFHSRALGIEDINGDGWPDIVASSEGAFIRGYAPKGLLAGINKEGKGWDIGLPVEGLNIYSDSLSLGDINGDGKTDIAMAPLTAKKEDKKSLWLGDGKGGFAFHPHDFGDMLTDRVGLGDVDKDGRDEIIFALSRTGEKGGGFFVKAYKWTPAGLADISDGLETLKNRPLIFDFADMDGDGKKEMILLTRDGLHLLKYGAAGWSELFHHPVAVKDTLGAMELKVARQTDGSFIIAYSLGKETPEYNKGLRAFLLNPRK